TRPRTVAAGGLLRSRTTASGRHATSGSPPPPPLPPRTAPPRSTHRIPPPLPHPPFGPPHPPEREGVLPPPPLLPFMRRTLPYDQHLVTVELELVGRPKHPRLGNPRDVHAQLVIVVLALQDFDLLADLGDEGSLVSRHGLGTPLSRLLFMACVSPML